MPVEILKRPLGPELVAPSHEYLVPSSNFFFTGNSSQGSLLQFIPAKSIANRLLDQYWDAVHHVARVLHRPTFERQWAYFWECTDHGVEPPASIQALVMGVLLSATISLKADNVAMQFNVPKSTLIDSFQKGVEVALAKANVMRTTRIHTLQAFILYLVAVCRTEVSRSHSALVAAAIKLAECMGLHRDGSHYGLPPVDIHVRRILWYQLCFLDIRTCEATGPRPQIRSEDFDTRLPLNVNDADLEGPDPPTSDSDRWTDMTLSLIRFDCVEMHRYIWKERPRLAEKKVTLTQVLGHIQEFIYTSEQKYMPMLNKKVHIQYLAMLIYRILTFRMKVMVLFRYVSTDFMVMPDRIRKILLSSGLQVIECGIIIETAPPLKKWAWYLGKSYFDRSSKLTEEVPFTYTTAPSSS
jgi:Fungal specific transcription factor domain